MCHFHFPNAIALTNVIALMHGSLFTLIVSLTLFVHKIVWFVLFDSSHKSRTKFHLIPILNHANVEMLRKIQWNGDKSNEFNRIPYWPCNLFRWFYSILQKKKCLLTRIVAVVVCRSSHKPFNKILKLFVRQFERFIHHDLSLLFCVCSFCAS